MTRGDIWWYMISYLVIDQVTSPKPGCLAPNQPSRSATDMPTIRKSCLGKKRHFQTKRTACCFVLTRLHMHLLHLCMKKLSADHDPSYLFICLYIHRCFNLFIIYFFIYAFIYLFTVFIYSFIYVDVFMYFGLSKCWVLRKIPTKWLFRGHPRFPSTYPIRWPRGEGIPFPGFTSPIPSTRARKKNTLWNLKMLNMMTWYFDSYY